jgi:hypothetical protein
MASMIENYCTFLVVEFLQAEGVSQSECSWPVFSAENKRERVGVCVRVLAADLKMAE